MKKIFVFLACVITINSYAQSLYVPSANTVDSVLIPSNVNNTVRKIYARDLLIKKLSITKYQADSTLFRSLIAAGGGGVGSSTWGSITGTLASQTDLNTVLNNKAALIHTHSFDTSNISSFAAKVRSLFTSGTGITYNNGVISSSFNGTLTSFSFTNSTGINGTVTNASTIPALSLSLTADALSDGSTNKAYTATEKTKLAAISGTNTGDETTATIKTKLSITTLSGSNTGDQDLSTLKLKTDSTANAGYVTHYQYDTAKTNLRNSISSGGGVENDSTGVNLVYGTNQEGRKGFYTAIPIFIDTTTLSNGDILKWDAVHSYWTNKPDTSGGGSTGGGGGGGTPSGALENLPFPTVVGISNVGTTWTGDGGSSYDNFALSSKLLGSGQNGWIQTKFVSSDNQAIIAFRTDSANQIWSANNYKAGAFCIGSGTVYYIDNGGSPTSTGITISSGNWFRVRRDVTPPGNFYIETSTDGTAWGSAIYTFSFTSTANQYIQMDIDGTQSCLEPKCFNCQ
jgi:hypothetical protein